MKIDIQVTEVLSRIVTVEAVDVQDAIMQVKNMYRNEDIVLDYADMTGKATFEVCEG
ncbi:MAG: DpnD/PcfM family protein [Epsilonproteobacteria bacterium]|nr:DpnD/PcfM family protein [Campylobacterota bacterium]